jgi:hypothetical protein
MINSALVSAQHRKRLYWTNIKGIEQPEDKHIYLKDVLESGYAIYNHYNSNINYDKSFTLGTQSGNITSFSGQSVITDIDNFFDKFTDKSCFDTKTACKSNVALEELKPYIRKLTPLECERLQTLPENYTKGISSRQRYKAIGNGFTIDVIAHIIKNIGG